MTETTKSSSSSSYSSSSSSSSPAAASKSTPQSQSQSKSSKSKSLLPTLRDSQYGYLNFIVLSYCLMADIVGACLLIRGAKGSSTTTSIGDGLLATVNTVLTVAAGILLSSHGRILSSYLVHEAAHANVFLQPYANRWFGVAALYAAGCPYCDFAHLKWMHASHHNDRADTVEFDYRAFIERRAPPPVRYAVLGCEYCFVPAVETVMHLRIALYPVVVGNTAYYADSDRNDKVIITSTTRNLSAMIGTPIQCLFYVYLYQQHPLALLYHAIAGIIVLQYLAFNDAFHHTYEAHLMRDYKGEGPGNRTHRYEQENTYSNVVSTRQPVWNALLSLNFGYHNAHHERAMTPWYNLPALHEQLYGKNSTGGGSSGDGGGGGGGGDGDGKKENQNNSADYEYEQLLPFYQIVSSWHKHRMRRVVEEDYGHVKSKEVPNRADEFIGSLGVSFLTV